MKNKSMSKFTAIVLLITMLTLIVIASTYAKYTSEFSGTGTATAAEWNVTLSGDGTTYEKTFTLEASDEIFPGGTGALGTVKVKNDSTLVNAKVVSVELTNGDSVPANLTLTPDYSSMTTIAPTETGEFTINYEWTYTQDDETSFAGQDIEFTIKLTVDQVVD